MGYENITVPFRDWNVVREIGSGSFGKVFEIRRDRYGIVERSAMKVIAVPQDPNEIRTYLRDGYAPETLRKMYDGSRASVLEEYQTMIKLKDCPNIVRCEDIEIVMDPDGIGSKIYIRMELLTPMREYDKMRSFNEAEQDDNAQDGTEAIEWIVLDKSENEQKILLISKYALDGKKYEGESSKATWDTCSLRSWLNYDFYYQAFSEKERNRIKETTVKAEWNREFDVNPGKDTLNKVFLLSRKEAEMYFSGQSARRCRCTYYGYTADVAQNEGEDACNWWLRSPGKSEREVAYINYNGEFGSKEVYAHLAVRPAIWISIESIISEDSPESGESPLDSRVDSNPLDDIFFGTGN